MARSEWLWRVMNAAYLVGLAALVVLDLRYLPGCAVLVLWWWALREDEHGRPV